MTGSDITGRLADFIWTWWMANSVLIREIVYAAVPTIVLCTILVVFTDGDYSLAMWSLGTALTVVCCFAIAHYVVGIRREIARVRNRKSLSKNTVYISVAPAASELFPLIDGLRKKGVEFSQSEFWLLGYDGRYVVENKDKRWKKYMERWTDNGLTVRYILLEHDAEVEDELFKLRSKFGDGFVPMILNEAKIEDQRDKDRVASVKQEFETFHPTLFLGPDIVNKKEWPHGQDAAWLEGLHRRNSVFAYRVRYVSPLAMEFQQKAEFDSYRDKISSLFCYCDLPKEQAPS